MNMPLWDVWGCPVLGHNKGRDQAENLGKLSGTWLWSWDRLVLVPKFSGGSCFSQVMSACFTSCEIETHCHFHKNHVFFLVRILIVRSQKGHSLEESGEVSNLRRFQ